MVNRVQSTPYYSYSIVMDDFTPPPVNKIHKPTTLKSDSQSWNMNVPETHILVRPVYPASGSKPESMISSLMSTVCGKPQQHGAGDEDDTLSSNGLGREKSSAVSGLADDWLIGWTGCDLVLGVGEIIHTWLRMVRMYIQIYLYTCRASFDIE